MNRSLLAATALAVLCAAFSTGALAQAKAPAKKPNILVIWGDDIGYWNVSAYNQGMMGYRTPNIDRIAKEGALFTDWYGQQSCTAGRAAFITGQSPFRTGLLKVGLPLMIITLVVGLAISLVQALTQIQEMTLAFVPKIVIVFGSLVLLLPFMLATLTGFMEHLMDKVAALG